MPPGEILTGSPDEFALSAPVAAAPAGNGVLIGDPSEFILSPMESTDVVETATRLGLGPDKKPILNVQAVDPDLRLATQLLFSNGQEKYDFLKKKIGTTHDIAIHPMKPTDVIVRRKGTSKWGVVDPGGMTVDELLPELQENIDTVAQVVSMPAKMLSAAFAAGGIQTARQSLKKIVDPNSDFAEGEVALDALAGGAAAGISTALGAGRTAAINTAKGSAKLAAQGAEAVNNSGIWTKAKNAVNILRQPKFVAQELGAISSEMNDFGKRAITENIAYLSENSPQFNEALKGFSRRAKYDSLKTYHEQLGKELGEVYSDAAVTVRIKDIVDGDAFKLLDDAARKRNVRQGEQRVKIDSKQQAKVQNIKRDMLEQVATLVLDDSSTAGLLKAYRQGKLHLDKSVKGLGAKNNDDALIKLIGEEELPLPEVFALRLGSDAKLKYGKGKGQISTLSTAQKYTADAYRDAIHKTIAEKLGIEGEEILTKSEVFHNLYPVLRAMGRSVGVDDAQSLNPIKVIPGVINSGTRAGVILARNLANRTEVRAALRGITGKLPLPEGSAPLSETAKSGVLSQMLRGGAFLQGRQVINKQFAPRNVDAFMEDPEMVNFVMHSVDDRDLTDSMVRQVERGDREGLANTLSIIASEHDDLFEPAPYRSLVMKGDIPVIQDKHDREAYRDWVEKNVPNAGERFDILNALNFDGTMGKPPFEVPKRDLLINAPNKRSARSASPISRVASKLRDIPSVDIDEDSERVDHDY